MTSRLLINFLLGLVLIFPGTAVFGMKDTSMYLFRDLSFSSGENNQHFQDSILKTDNQDFAGANTHSDMLVTNVAADKRIDTLTFARVLANASIIKTRLNQLPAALDLLNRSIVLVNAESAFHNDIYPLMMIKAQILIEQGELVKATDLLRRAQHITHRHDGVYSERQIDVVDLIADISMARRDFLEADRQQLFNLKIGEHVLGADSIALVPRLEKVGEHFRERGVRMPFIYSPAVSEAPILKRKDRSDIFSESLLHYNRALKILEDNYGPNDLRLVNTLRSIARTRLEQISGRRYAEDILARVVRIIASNPVDDIPEHAAALIQLGDTYTINGNNKAAQTYLEAWNLLAQSPELEGLQEEIFNAATRIFPSSGLYSQLSRRPLKTQPGEEVYINATYTVREDGRASEVDIIDGNAPVEQKKHLRLWLKESRFRPRIEEGQLVRTEDIPIRQTFRIFGETVVQDTAEQ